MYRQHPTRTAPNRLLTLLLATVLAWPLLAACSREPTGLDSRIRAAVTPPPVIADWIIQGRNDFMVFDLRSELDFAAGHLPNAVRVDPRTLSDPGVVRALPDYKKLVFYNGENAVSGELLGVLFERGLHVMILQGGYAGWQRTVLGKPAQVVTREDAKRDAVAKYFRGESAMGTPEPLKKISADRYLRPPRVPAAQPAPTYQAEGC